MKNKIKELNKKRVGAIAVVLLLAFIIAANYFISNKQEWTKYSGHPDNTFVTSNELETQKQKVYDESKQLILDTISNEDVVKQLDYLGKQKLTEEQQQTLSDMQLLHISFEETKEYSLDEIISLATDYSKLVDDLESLFTEVKATELTKSINDLEKKIQEHQKSIKELDLTSGEQKEFDKQIKLYNDVKFNKDNVYNLEELESIKTKFTEINKQLEALNKNAKERIAKDKAEAEKQLAQANVYNNQSVYYTESNYAGNTNNNTNTSSANTLNSGSNNASTSSQRCEFSSNEELIAYGESTGRGYQGVPCGDGSYRINIFDGDNTGNNNGFYID